LEKIIAQELLQRMKEIYRDQSCWPLILTQAANFNSLPLFKKMAAALRNQKLTVEEVI
jgi:hypothetical protein